jgi:hypothetical protein
MAQDVIPGIEKTLSEINKNTLYTPELLSYGMGDHLWSATTIFLGQPDLTAKDIIDSFESAYIGISIGAVKWSDVWFIICAPNAHSNLNALAVVWSAKPIWRKIRQLTGQWS